MLQFAIYLGLHVYINTLYWDERKVMHKNKKAQGTKTARRIVHLMKDLNSKISARLVSTPVLTVQVICK